MKLFYTLMIAIVIMGVSFFNERSQTENEKAKCDVAKTQFLISNVIEDSPFGGFVEDDPDWKESRANNYIRVYKDCTLVSQIDLMVDKDEAEAKINRFFQSFVK